MLIHLLFFNVKREKKEFSDIFIEHRSSAFGKNARRRVKHARQDSINSRMPGVCHVCFLRSVENILCGNTKKVPESKFKMYFADKKQCFRM